MDHSSTKPLGRKAYGSIPHLPGSRTGPSDHSINEGQGRMLTEKARDEKDLVIVQEKLDGSCTAVAMINGKIHSLQRKGYPAVSSPYRMHHDFSYWVDLNKDRFHSVLNEGERIVGEWLGQAHGTIYDLRGRDPWAAFDIMKEDVRIPFEMFLRRIAGMFLSPHVLHIGSSISVEDALWLLKENHWPCAGLPEGVVYRLEREGKVNFLAKWVHPGKEDGKYLNQALMNIGVR